MLKPVFDLVNNAESLEDLQGKLDGLYELIDDAAVAKSVEKAGLIGEVWGKLSYQAQEGAE